MTNSWLRLWHDMPTDPKFRVVARKAGRPLSEVVALFTLMLTNASANTDNRGYLLNWSDEDAAAALDMDSEHVEAIRAAMQGKLLHDDALTGWEKRQPKREDSSSQRVRAFRERKKRDVTDETHVKLDVTQRNAPDKDTDTDTEKIQNQTDGPADSDAARVKRAFNGHTDEMVGEVLRAMGVGCDRWNAEKWLAGLLAINGSEAVKQAFMMLQTNRAEGQSIARVLPWWSKTAATLASKDVGRKPAAGGSGEPRPLSVYEVWKSQQPALAAANGGGLG